MSSQVIREHFQIKQTIVTISALEKSHIEAAKRSIMEERILLEEFIQKDPFFALTLDPYDLLAGAGPGAKSAPDIVRQMVCCSAVFGIGPMSAVAGAIAKFAVEAMREAGAEYAIVDNGGDISILNNEPVLVGIYAGSSPIKDIALEIPPRTRPLGICTSSGTVGPSISFGCADAALVISKDPALADAAATALGNAVTPGIALDQCFRAIDRPGIEGAVAIRGDEMAIWGEVPRIARARINPERITKE